VECHLLGLSNLISEEAAFEQMAMLEGWMGVRVTVADMVVTVVESLCEGRKWSGDAGDCGRGF
jgi:hypothetical protein